MATTDEALFEMHGTGRILQWSGTAWTTISTSYSTRQMVTTADDLFARRADGEILVYDGGNWVRISNPDMTVVAVSSDGETLFRQHSNGRVYRYRGTPLTGWQLVKW